MVDLRQRLEHLEWEAESRMDRLLVHMVDTEDIRRFIRVSTLRIS
jgi:hypothetical protein